MKLFWKIVKRKPKDRLPLGPVDNNTRASLPQKLRHSTIELESYQLKRRRLSTIIKLVVGGLLVATAFTLLRLGWSASQMNGTVPAADAVLADSCAAAYHAVHGSSPLHVIHKPTHQISVTEGDAFKFLVTTNDHADEITHIPDVILGPRPKVVELGIEPHFMRGLRLNSRVVDARIEGIVVSTNRDLARMMLKHLTGALYYSDSRDIKKNSPRIASKYNFMRKSEVAILHNNRRDASGSLLADICLTTVISNELTGEDSSERHTTVASALVAEKVAIFER